MGGPGAPDIAWQTDSYIIGQKEAQWFSPDFTYHTYRFMEIKGLKEKPEIDDVRGLFMHTNVTNENSFSSSSALLNSIQDAAERTFLANLVSVQSDCPAREEIWLWRRFKCDKRSLHLQLRYAILLSQNHL